jgi:hypothetical protein
MSTTKVVNSVGLFFDIAGAILVWRYGLPAKLDRDGTTFFALQAVNQEEKEKAKLYDQLGKLGLGLLVVGFVLQLVSNFI